MNKLFDKPIESGEEEHQAGGKRTFKVYKFLNMFGASIVRHRIPAGDKRMMLAFDGSYYTYTNNEHEWELAVLRFKRDGSSELCYDSGITEDVIGWLSEEDVEEWLEKIKALPGGSIYDAMKTT